MVFVSVRILSLFSLFSVFSWRAYVVLEVPTTMAWYIALSNNVLTVRVLHDDVLSLMS